MAQQETMNIMEFMKRFATEKACREYLYQIRWPEGFICPKCGTKDEPYQIKCRHQYQCRHCNGSTIITTNGGKALISGLSKQAYTITETKAPDGFEGYFEPVVLDVTEKNTAESPFLVTIMNAPEGGKSGTGAKTGGDGLPMWMLFVGIAAATGGTVIFILRKKKSNHEA